jgi:hypothetical protein
MVLKAVEYAAPAVAAAAELFDVDPLPEGIVVDPPEGVADPQPAPTIANAADPRIAQRLPFITMVKILPGPIRRPVLVTVCGLMPSAIPRRAPPLMTLLSRHCTGLSGVVRRLRAGGTILMDSPKCNGLSFSGIDCVGELNPFH